MERARERRDAEHFTLNRAPARSSSHREQPGVSSSEDPGTRVFKDPRLGRTRHPSHLRHLAIPSAEACHVLCSCINSTLDTKWISRQAKAKEETRGSIRTGQPVCGVSSTSHPSVPFTPYFQAHSVPSAVCTAWCPIHYKHVNSSSTHRHGPSPCPRSPQQRRSLAPEPYTTSQNAQPIHSNPRFAPPAQGKIVFGKQWPNLS